jgi:uncharacterized protein YgbK (DUF1537 family)
MEFGIVADDNTGATDAAGMLTERGVRTVLVLGTDALDEAAQELEGFDAVVVGTQNRSVAPDEAARRTAEAVGRLDGMGAQKLQVKYCSTFDSTPEGNIGPTLDAALDTLGARGTRRVPATIVTPALPVNGRTTYNGYHFVDGVLLSESPLRHHPLNPMTDANLVRWLQQQTERRVGCVRLDDVRPGPEHMRRALDALVEDGVAYIVTDAVEQSDLAVTARATAGDPLISGGSGITAEVAGLLRPDGAPLSFVDRLRALPQGMLVVSGSMSPATRAQNAHALAAGFEGVALDGRRLLDTPDAVEEAVGRAQEHLGAGRPVVVYSRADSPQQVRAVQLYGLSLGLDATGAGERIAGALARIAARLVARGRVGRLVISGGETSGAACAALGFDVLEVGLPIRPGVPYCFPASHPDLMVVLKSGNFGGPDFYELVRALG